MPTLKLHYDGWIALPAGLRRALDLNSGDRLEADLVEGTLVLRPASGTRSTRARAEVAEPVEPSPDTLLLVGQPEETTKPSRPTRKTAEGAGAAAPRRRGRPPKANVAVPPRPVSHAPVGIGPAKLIKKSDLEPSSVVQALPPAPVARPRPERITQSVERRPFRNVEIRPLGPGRGHNSPRRLRPGP
ncbi:MAG: AbrB/MazE/SpoVT family DNA-binding domain-containing protein [Geminicoccaceae bacterium]